MSLTTPRDPYELLVISLLFPPILEPRAIQVGRLVEHLSLPRTTICASAGHLMNDPAMTPPRAGQGGEVLRVPFRTNRPQRVLWNLAARRNLPLLFRMPDKYAAWARPAARLARSLLVQPGRRFGAVASFAQPWSSHLAALRAVERTDLPWLVYMSDPWATPLFGRVDRLTRAYNFALEKKVFQRATYILFASRELAELTLTGHQGRFDRKIRILPHGYDPAAYPNQDAPQSENIVLRYLGSFYGARNPLPLFAALGRLCQESPELLSKVKLEIVGDYDPAFLADPAFTSLPPGLVTFRPMVPYRESLRLMQQADGLLLVDAPGVTCVFPAKLVDYLGSGTPVLGITPQGPARRIIQAQDGLVADPGQPEQIAAMLRRFLSDHPKGQPKVPQQTRYDITNVAKQFEALVEEARQERAETGRG